jgi:peroxiredoxin
MRRIAFFFFLTLGFNTLLFAQQGLKVGQIMTNLSLLSTNGTIYDLNAQKGAKGFILVFMTPTCDHCRAYENRIVALNKKYKIKGYPMVAIGPYGDDPVKYPLDAMPEMKKLAESKGFKFPYVSDDHFKYTFMLGIKKTPTAVVLQKKANGYLIKYIGIIDDEQDERIPPKNKFVEQVVNKLI